MTRWFTALARWARQHKKWVVLAGVAVLLPGVGVLGLWPWLQAAAEAMRASPGLWWGIFAIVAGMACGLAVLPTHAISLAGGFVFGLIPGTLAALLAVLVGSGIGWTVTRRVGGKSLSPTLEQSRWGRRLSRSMIEARGGRACSAVALARLPPQVPFAFGTVLAAGLGVRLVPLLLGTALGMLPRVAAAAWVGHGLEQFRRDGDPAALTVGLVAGVVGLLGLAIWGWRLVNRAEPEATSSQPAQ